MPAPVPALDVPAPAREVAGSFNLLNIMKAFTKLKAQIANRLYRSTYPTPPEFGIHHYIRDNDQGKTRIHLRIENDGHGLILFNASRVCHLNPTATYMAYLYLQEMSPSHAIAALKHQYNVSSSQIKNDYNRLIEQLQELISPNGACPICDLELDTLAPFSVHPSAPYRMDLAITYRCNLDCAHCYNVRSRQGRELNTDQWKQILDQLWDIGIPHVVFTGGEPTLRSDLSELIAYAELNGQITGLNTNGNFLKSKTYIKELVNSGLDHVQITIESHDPKIHGKMVNKPGAWEDTIAGIKNALSSSLYVMTNTTMLTTNATQLKITLQFLADLGVPTIGLNALIYSGRGLTVGTGLQESDLPALLETARHITKNNNQRLIWYTPTQYCHFDPVQMELGVKGCTAALYNMCIEPDGSVIPCQSYYHSLGNILYDQWDSIWNHDIAISLRERRNVPASCTSCTMLQICGGGCPLARQSGHYADPVPFSPLQVEEMEV